MMVKNMQSLQNITSLKFSLNDRNFSSSLNSQKVIQSPGVIFLQCGSDERLQRPIIS